LGITAVHRKGSGREPLLFPSRLTKGRMSYQGISMVGSWNK
jgi:hypothetical protein